MGSCLRVEVRMILMSSKEAEQGVEIETGLSRAVRGVGEALHRAVARRRRADTGGAG